MINTSPFWRTCLENVTKDRMHTIFVCTVVQRIARAPQLCHSLLSNAKQEINVACCVYLYVCIYVCVSPDTSGCQCFALGGKSVCVCVCERETEAERDPSAQAKRKAMPGKTGQYHASLCCIPKLQINVLVQFSSQANLSCLLCFNKTGLKSLTTWISPNAGT